MNPELLLAPSRLSPAASSIVVFLLGGLVFAVVLTIAATLLSYHRQRATLARDSVRTDVPRFAGPAVISGTVAIDDGRPHAARVEIFQYGTEWQNKGTWYTTWKETSRHVESRPFHLVTAGGARVRVEPGKDLFLVDALDRETRRNRQERILAAELSPGERVTISGVLAWTNDPEVAASSYRAHAGKALVLKPPRAEPMLISSEPLEQRHLRHAALHKRMLLITAILWVVFHAIAFGQYDLLSWFGDVVEGQVERTDTWTTRSKSTTTRHYGVAAAWRDTSGQWRVVHDEVSYEAYAWFQANPESKVPFRVAGDFGLSSVGRRPTIARTTGMIALIVNVALIVVYWVQARRALAWYERKRLVQTAAGRL